MIDRQIALVRAEKLSCSVRSGFWMKRLHLLDDVSLQVGRGEIVALLGKNGAGKTTLLQILSGVRRPNFGTVQLSGTVGYLPERPYFYEHLDALRFLAFLGEVSGMTRSGAEEKAKGLLKQIGLESFAKKSLRNFSKGMLQRVGVAQALMHDPDLLILDEPMSGLDAEGRSAMQTLLSGWVGTRKALLMTTHSFADAEVLADRILHMNQGRIERELINSGGRFSGTNSQKCESLKREIIWSHDDLSMFSQRLRDFIESRARPVDLVLLNCLERAQVIRVTVQGSGSMESLLRWAQHESAQVVGMHTLGLATEVSAEGNQR